MLISRATLVGLLSLALSACSIWPLTPTPAPTEIATLGTAPSPSVTAAPANTSVPVPAVGAPTNTPSLVPPKWAALNVTGTLVFITATVSTQSVTGLVPILAALNLNTGALQTLFTAPPSAILSSGTMSPDGQHIALVYAPPPTAGEVQYGFPGIYLLPGDGQGQPQPLLDRTQDKHAFFQATWSPDSAYIYYTHYDPHFDGTSYYTPTYTVERWNLSQGAAEVIATGAYWPRLSNDGTQLVYVTLDATNTRNELYVADPEGKEAKRIDLPEGLIIDVPLFSPDGQWIYFSAADLSFPAANWIDRLWGVQTAEASPNPHSIPSDWWRVPVAGGDPEELTSLYGSALYGAFSRDGRYLAFVSAGGVYVTDPLGQNITTLAFDTLLVGTLDWLP